MFETDADRLAMIKSLGGQPVRVDTVELLAIFDNDFVEIGTDGAGVESTGPALQCRTSDITRLGIEPRTIVRLEFMGEQIELEVRRHEPDGTGMSVLRLRQVV